MNTKKLLKTSLCLTFVIAIAISTYLYLYKEHRNIDETATDYVVTVSGLEKEFSSNEALAYSKYQDKIIELTSTISSVDPSSKAVVLGEKVFVTFKTNLPKKIVSGATLKIKGRFLGYDELLQEFKIDQSSVVQSNL